MTLNTTQLTAIAAVLADVPTLDLDALLDQVTTEVYASSKGLILKVDTYDAKIEKHRLNLLKVGVTNPHETDAAAVPGDPREFGRGLWILGEPVRQQPDITSTLERAIVKSVRRAFTDVGLGN